MSYIVFLQMSKDGEEEFHFRNITYFLAGPSNFTSSLVSALGLDNNCFVVSNKLYLYDSNKTGEITLFSEMKILSSENCPYEFLIGKLKALELKYVSMNISISSQRMSFRLSHYVKPEKDLYSPLQYFFTIGDLKWTYLLYRYVYQDSNTFRTGFATVVVKHAFTCPYIILNETEACQLATNINTSASCFENSHKHLKLYVTVFVDGLNVIKSYHVCVKDYLNARKRNNHIEHTNLELITSFMLTILSILLIFFVLRYNEKTVLSFLILKRTVRFFLCVLISAHITCQMEWYFISNEPLCGAFKFLNFYFWLAATFSFAVYGITILRKLKADDSHNTGDIKCTQLVPLLSPLFFILTILSANLIKYRRLLHRWTSHFCVITDPITEGLFFTLPIVLTAVFNTLIFKKIMCEVANAPGHVKTMFKKSCYPYLETIVTFSVISTIVWCTGFLSNIFPSRGLNFGFVTICCGQSVFVFVFSFLLQHLPLYLKK